MTNRLATIKPDNRGALRTVLDHLADADNGERYVRDEHEAIIHDEHGNAVHTDYGLATHWLASPEYGATQIADELTRYARDTNLGVRIGEKAIRDYRKNHQ